MRGWNIVHFMSTVRIITQSCFHYYSAFKFHELDPQSGFKLETRSSVTHDVPDACENCGRILLPYTVLFTLLIVPIRVANNILSH